VILKDSCGGQARDQISGVGEEEFDERRVIRYQWRKDLADVIVVLLRLGYAGCAGLVRTRDKDEGLLEKRTLEEAD
jgi:hypothetical protein